MENLSSSQVFSEVRLVFLVFYRFAMISIYLVVGSWMFGLPWYSFIWWWVRGCSVCHDIHLFGGGFVYYLCYFYFSTYKGVQHDFHIQWCSMSRRFIITPGVLLVRQKLRIFPEHMRTPCFIGVGVAQSLVFCVMFCRPLFVFLAEPTV